MRRLTSAPLVTPFDAPLASLLTPLHATRLGFGICGLNCYANPVANPTKESILRREIIIFSPVELLHRYRDVCVPGDVNLVANLKLVEHGRIDDTSLVFPSVRASEGDR